jgi:TP901 family phage tail tape measure protein
MADYKVHLGVKLNTSDINSQISKYKASPINIKTDLDTSGIAKAINGYKAKAISIDSILNTDGITDKIRAYTPPKKIHLESDLSTAGIDKKINNYAPKKPIIVDVELNKSNINQQIANAKPTQSIKINAELNKGAISEAIRNYKATTPVKVTVDPDFSRIDALVKNYIPKNLLRVNVKLNKGEIDRQLKNFQTSAKIEVGAKLRDNAIEKAIRTYAGKELVPITVDFKVGETKEITNKINEYKNKDISIPVKLRPAQTGFDSEITKKPVRVQATLDPDGIDSVIDTFKPTSRIKVGVKLDPKDINGQVAKLPKPTDPLDVDVRLNSNSVNNAVAKLAPTSRLKVGVDLQSDDINQQIDAIHPTSKIKVDVHLDNSDINKETGKQNAQTPVVVNVKLDRDGLNEQIRNYKTQTKLKVGIKLDFVGIPKQIKDYKTKSKLKVGVELDRDSIAQEISAVKTDTPIKLGVELDPEDINKIKGQVGEIKQQLEALGNVRINLGGSTTGATNTTTGSGGGTGATSTGAVRTNVAQGIREADIKIVSMKEHTEELSDALKEMGFKDADIEGITNKLEEMDVVVNRVVTRLDKNNNTMLTVMGTDKTGRNNVTLTKGTDVDNNPVEFVKVSQKIGETERFLKQQKKAAADLTNQINQMNRAATDSNARKPIQDTAHLDSLKAKYNEIILAIEAMGNASSDTFEDERIKVKALISEYKSLKSEYKNAENVSTKYDGNSYSTGLEEARQDLIAFKREASNFPQIAQTVKELDDAFEKVGDAGSLQDFTRQLGVAKSELGNLKAEANDAYKALLDAQKKIENLSTQTARLNPETNPKQLAELSKQLEEAEADYQSLKNAFSGKLSTSQFGTLQANADDLAKTLKAIEEKHKDTRAELARKISIHLEAGKFTEQVARADSNANKLADTSQKLQTKLEALHNAQMDMNTAFASDNVDEQIAAYRRYQRILEDVNNQIKINTIQERNAIDAQKLQSSKQGLSSDMTSWLRENSAAAKRFGDEIKRLQAQLNACDNSVDFNNIKQEFRNVQKEAKALGLTGLTTFDKLKYKFKEYMAYFSVAEVFMYASQGLRDMFEQVKLIDSAMTELKKVTNETDAAYSKFLENAAKRSKEIGTTIDGLVASTADFARLGYGFEDAQGLAEVANIYAVVGDEIEGVEGATKSLISTMAAFQDEMNGMSNSDFAMSIIDKFNEIGNNFAISSGGIGEALERSASSLQAANNTIDESIALITAANTVVQNPEAVGTAWKTISMRIRGAKTEMSELGLDTEGMVESTAKLRSEILALSGVDIMEADNKTFKSTYQIMDELAQKWEDLSDIQQAKCLPDNVEIH